MAKSDLTLELETEIWKATNKQGVFSCFEVTIGWYGQERVDYLTYDTKGIFRCYEIKVSKSDFHSKAHITFIGHYNYYVMPLELYEQVKDEIPDHIGVYCGAGCRKKAKKQELGVADQVLKDSMIRSLYREYEKQYKSGIPTAIEALSRRLRRSEADKEKYRRQYWDLMRMGQEKYGNRWYKD